MQLDVFRMCPEERHRCIGGSTEAKYGGSLDHPQICSGIIQFLVRNFQEPSNRARGCVQLQLRNGRLACQQRPGAALPQLLYDEPSSRWPYPSWLYRRQAGPWVLNFQHASNDTERVLNNRIVCTANARNVLIPESQHQRSLLPGIHRERQEAGASTRVPQFGSSSAQSTELAGLTRM